MKRSIFSSLVSLLNPLSRKINTSRILVPTCTPISDNLTNMKFKEKGQLLPSIIQVYNANNNIIKTSDMGDENTEHSY